MSAYEDCGSCCFYLSEDGVTICRRFPPVTHIVGVAKDTGSPVMQAVFPPMHPTGWCGEYAEKSSPAGLAGLARDRSN